MGRKRVARGLMKARRLGSRVGLALGWRNPQRGAAGRRFAADYQALVDDLLLRHPLDEAMSFAVGGAFDRIGRIELDILRRAGLQPGMALLDMGCGSGRLASALGGSGIAVRYTGIDVVQKLLDYAAARNPPDFRFVLNHSLTVPAATGAMDMACAFSLFTHLLHHETYLYLQDIHRVLKPRGRLVFSFLELAADGHWPVFEATVEAERGGGNPVLNSFIEQNVIEIWAAKLGFAVESYIEPTEGVGPAGSLGQTTAILRRG